MVVVTSAWLGRCSQLVPSPARSIVNVFLALCGRYRDKDTRRTNRNEHWKTYRHTLSIQHARTYKYARTRKQTHRYMTDSLHTTTPMYDRITNSNWMNPELSPGPYLGPYEPIWGPILWLAPMNTSWNRVDTLCNQSPSILEHMDRSYNMGDTNVAS